MRNKLVSCFHYFLRKLSYYIFISSLLLATLYTTIVFLYYKQNRLFHITPLLITGIMGTALILSVPVIWRRLALDSKSKVKFCFKFVIEITLVSAVCMLLSIFLASFNSLWCCTRHSDVTEVCTVARVVTQLLDKSGIFYFLCFGSALGVYRNNGTQIPHEHDVDICILNKDEEKVNQVLSESGIQYMSNYKTDPKFVLSFRVFPFDKSMFGMLGIRQKWIMLWIDIYSYHIVEKKWKWKDQTFGGVADEVIRPVSSAYFCGSPEFKVPNLLPSYLEKIYGEEFRIPKVFGKFKQFSCNLWYDDYGL